MFSAFHPSSSSANPGSQPVSHLKGCGKQTTERFHANGIRTLTDLVKFDGTIRGVAIDKFKRQAKEALRCEKEIAAHNWKSRVVHVICAKGRVTRAEIGNLVIGPHITYLWVTWREKKGMVRKKVSPVNLLCANVMWFNGDIISDDEDEDSPELGLEPVKEFLPKFFVDPQNFMVQQLTTNEKAAIKFVVREINQLHNCAFPKDGEKALQVTTAGGHVVKAAAPAGDDGQAGDDRKEA